MKRIVLLSILALIVVVSTVRAQPPQRMSYQSVLRDNANQVIASKQVRLRVSMLADSMNATPVYTETHQVTTNAQGLIQLEIGGGTVISGSYAAIPWSRGRLFIKTDIDPAGGTNYTLTSTTQLLSVPYAQYAGDLPVSKSGDTVRIGNAKLLIPGSVLLSSGTGNAPATLSEGLVAYYPFNGNANDESGNGNHGVVNGAKLTSDRNAKPYSAYSFNGINNYIEIKDTNSLDISGSISICVWIKLDSVNPVPFRLIDKSTVGLADAYMIDFLHEDRIRFIVAQASEFGTQPESNPLSVVRNQYFHFVVTYDEKIIKFYVNGKLNRERPFSGKSSINSNPLRFAASSNLSGEWFKGDLDEIRIYNRAISDTEVLYLANN